MILLHTAYLSVILALMIVIKQKSSIIKQLKAVNGAVADRILETAEVNFDKFLNPKKGK